MAELVAVPDGLTGENALRARKDAVHDVRPGSCFYYPPAEEMER